MEFGNTAEMQQDDQPPFVSFPMVSIPEAVILDAVDIESTGGTLRFSLRKPTAIEAGDTLEFFPIGEKINYIKVTCRTELGDIRCVTIAKRDQP